MNLLRSAAAGAAALVSVLTLAPPAHADLTWDRVTANFTWPRGALLDVEATGPNDVWIVGTQGEVCYFQNLTHTPDTGPPYEVRHRICPIPPKPVTQRWDGTRWTSYDPWNFFGGMGSVHKIHAKGPGNVYLQGTGVDGTPVFAHWNGTALTRLPAFPEKCRFGYTKFVHGSFWVLDGQSASCAWNGTSWTVVPDLWRMAFLPEGVFGLHRREDPGGAGMHDTQGYVAKFTDNAWQEIFAIDVKEIDPAATDMFLELRVNAENDIWVQINVIKGSGMPGSRHFGHWDGTTFTYDPAQAPPENCCRTPVPYDPEPAEPPAELRPTPPAGYRLTAFTQIPGTGQYWAVGAGQEDVPNAKTDLLILKSR